MSKSKYGDLIRKAREPENQETIEPENQKVDDLEDQQTKQPENQETIEPDVRTSIKPDNQITSHLEIQKDRKAEKEVNLCVKVPESLRRHWAAEAKREGITMTEVMVEALIQKFGKPDSQTTR